MKALERRFGDLSMRPKLIGVFLLVGITPMCVAAMLAYFNGSRSLHEATTVAEEALTESAFEKLTASRSSRSDAIERYFESIRHQVLTLSIDRMVVDAMREFPAAFASYRDDRGIGPADLVRMRESVEAYYLDQFDALYREQNEGKASEAPRYVEELNDDSIAFQYSFISSSPHPLGEKHLLDLPAGDDSRYAQLHERVHPAIRDFLERFGYYDIFLAETGSGNIVYSVFKELDYSTSLVHGSYADTNFGEAFRAADQLPAGEFALFDFRQYAPSYEAPASFIAAPVFDGGERLGVLLFQMPLDTITEVMSARHGLGEGGDAFMVGPDHLMRSDSHLNPEQYSVVYSFRHAETARFEADCVERAMAGESGEERRQNFAGEPVLATFGPVDVGGGIRWALVTETPAGEALSTVTELATTKNSALQSLLTRSLLTGVLSIVFIVLVAMYVAGMLVRPLLRTVAALQRVAKGDLSTTIDVDSKDEIGQMAKALNQSFDHIREAFRGFAEGTRTLEESSVRLITVSSQMSANADQTKKRAESSKGLADNMSTSVQTVATAAQEMSASAKEIAENTTRSAQTAAEASTVVEKTDATAEQLSTSSQQIGDVTKTITDIAEQTKDLAAQAASQAQLATEAGKGFGVVANEVKELAKATSQATEDITTKIEQSQKVSERVTDSTRKMIDIVERMKQTAVHIAESVDRWLQDEPAPEPARELVGAGAAVESREGNGASHHDGRAGISRIAGRAQEAVSVSRQAEELSRGISNAMTDLDDSRSAITSVLASIGDIARQTNLLALNATIEAGRASTAAQGFGGLATQVHDLAERTSKATEEIGDRVGEIQGDSGAVVTAVGSIRAIVEKIETHASSVAAAVEQQNATIDEISRNVSQVADGSVEIAQDISTVADAAQSTAQGSDETQQAAEGLAKLNGELRVLVDRFEV